MHKRCHPSKDTPRFIVACVVLLSSRALPGVVTLQATQVGTRPIGGDMAVVVLLPLTTCADNRLCAHSCMAKMAQVKQKDLFRKLIVCQNNDANYSAIFYAM